MSGATIRSPRDEKRRDYRRSGWRAQPDVAAAFRSEYDPRKPIEEQLRQLWRELIAGIGGKSWHQHDSRRSDEGWPDESTVIPGHVPSGNRLLFLELKAPGKQPTPEQRECLQLLADAGQEVYLVTSTGDRGRDLLQLAELLNAPRGKRGEL